MTNFYRRRIDVKTISGWYTFILNKIKQILQNSLSQPHKPRIFWNFSENFRDIKCVKCFKITGSDEMPQNHNGKYLYVWNFCFSVTLSRLFALQKLFLIRHVQLVKLFQIIHYRFERNWQRKILFKIEFTTILPRFLSQKNSLSEIGVKYSILGTKSRRIPYKSRKVGIILIRPCKTLGLPRFFA